MGDEYYIRGTCWDRDGNRIGTFVTIAPTRAIADWYAQTTIEFGPERPPHKSAQIPLGTVLITFGQNESYSDEKKEDDPSN